MTRQRIQFALALSIIALVVIVLGVIVIIGTLS